MTHCVATARPQNSESADFETDRGQQPEIRKSTPRKDMLTKYNSRPKDGGTAAPDERCAPAFTADATARAFTSAEKGEDRYLAIVRANRQTEKFQL